MAESDISTWKILYPNYLNSSKTQQEGRLVAKEDACEDPKVVEMAQICNFYKLPNRIESKAYPRDWQVPGRIRYVLKQNGKLVNPEIKSKKDLLRKMGALIPKLQSRQAKEDAATAASSTTGSSTTQQALPASSASGDSQPAEGAGKKSKNKRKKAAAAAAGN